MVALLLVNACKKSEVPGDKGKNISLIGGMSIDGLIATDTEGGSVNTDVFLFYIQEILIPIVLDWSDRCDG
jgi:hypothetical protein